MTHTLAALDRLAILADKSPEDIARALETFRQKGDDQPWYFTALLTAGGWLAATFVAGAIWTFMALVLDIETPLVAAGLAAAVAILGLIAGRTLTGDFAQAFVSAAILGGYGLHIAE